MDNSIAFLMRFPLVKAKDNDSGHWRKERLVMPNQITSNPKSDAGCK
ncbi:hypothetical protein CULC0102_2078 [Corynebacterium ulcerans 0102]|nr:hypothetical protein CULC0102_2078 [Corynebacterium ulcerans 0102]BBJ72907.1 hypothetical protein CULC0211_20410 [Corynebacterium ulcerans]